MNILVIQGAAIFELLASEDESLLVGRDALLVLDFSLDIVDGVRGLDFEGDGLSGESLNKDLHGGLWRKNLKKRWWLSKESERGDFRTGGFKRIQTPPTVTAQRLTHADRWLATI